MKVVLGPWIKNFNENWIKLIYINWYFNFINIYILIFFNVLWLLNVKKVFVNILCSPVILYYTWMSFRLFLFINSRESYTRWNIKSEILNNIKTETIQICDDFAKNSNKEISVISEKWKKFRVQEISINDHRISAGVLYYIIFATWKNGNV